MKAGGSARRDKGGFTVLARPPGRGNWAPLVISVSGRHGPRPLDLHPGQVLKLGAQRFRVVSVFDGG
jgi:hypothetical protein